MFSNGMGYDEFGNPVGMNGGCFPNQGMYGQPSGVQSMGRRMTKRDIIEILRYNYGASDVVQVDDFDSERARHVCQGGTQILLLDKTVQPMQVSDFETIQVEVFFCPQCRKLIVNKSSLDFY